MGLEAHGRELAVRKAGCPVAVAVRAQHAHSRQGQPCRAVRPHRAGAEGGALRTTPAQTGKVIRESVFAFIFHQNDIL